MFNKAICWIRRDLRLHDHRPLAEATRRAEKVVMVFVFDTKILSGLSDKGDRRVTFIHESLAELDLKLRARGSKLVVLYGDPVIVVPKLAREIKAEAVFTGRDYEPYAIDRDQRVQICLAEFGVDFIDLKDQVIFEKTEILTQAGQVPVVYTPYSKAWLKAIAPTHYAESEPDFRRLWPAQELPDFPLLSIEQLGFIETEPWLEPGGDAGRKRLTEFAARIDRYGDDRDYPAKHGTSGLSVHFRFGTVSIREAVRFAMEREGPGPTKWLNELIWREFYQMILANFPHVVSGAFKPQFDEVQWPGSEEHFQAWCVGQTGYPLVDAAMRCLNSTGWMHNRLRMVTAMFLTKDLLVDWRKGEAYFAAKLLDFDLAQNNGGWQWSASTGVDAQPYFRIFNPILQSRKFDPEGAFIREWVPELSDLNNEEIHWPFETPQINQFFAMTQLPDGYPPPIVDHGIQREIAVKLLEIAKT